MDKFSRSVQSFFNTNKEILNGDQYKNFELRIRIDVPDNLLWHGEYVDYLNGGSSKLTLTETVKAVKYQQSKGIHPNKWALVGDDGFKRIYDCNCCQVNEEMFNTMMVCRNREIKGDTKDEFPEGAQLKSTNVELSVWAFKDISDVHLQVENRVSVNNLEKLGYMLEKKEEPLMYSQEDANIYYDMYCSKAASSLGITVEEYLEQHGRLEENYAWLYPKKRVFPESNVYIVLSRKSCKWVKKNMFEDKAIRVLFDKLFRMFREQWKTIYSSFYFYTKNMVLPLLRPNRLKCTTMTYPCSKTILGQQHPLLNHNVVAIPSNVKDYVLVMNCSGLWFCNLGYKKKINLLFTFRHLNVPAKIKSLLEKNENDWMFALKVEKITCFVEGKETAVLMYHYPPVMMNKMETVPMTPKTVEMVLLSAWNVLYASVHPSTPDYCKVAMIKETRITNFRDIDKAVLDQSFSLEANLWPGREPAVLKNPLRLVIVDPKFTNNWYLYGTKVFEFAYDYFIHTLMFSDHSSYNGDESHKQVYTGTRSYPLTRLISRDYAKVVSSEGTDPFCLTLCKLKVTLGNTDRDRTTVEYFPTDCKTVNNLSLRTRVQTDDMWNNVAHRSVGALEGEETMNGFSQAANTMVQKIFGEYLDKRDMMSKSILTFSRNLSEMDNLLDSIPPKWSCYRIAQNCPSCHHSSVRDAKEMKRELEEGFMRIDEEEHKAGAGSGNVTSGVHVTPQRAARNLSRKLKEQEQKKDIAIDKIAKLEGELSLVRLAQQVGKKKEVKKKKKKKKKTPRVKLSEEEQSVFYENVLVDEDEEGEFDDDDDDDEDEEDEEDYRKFTLRPDNKVGCLEDFYHLYRHMKAKKVEPFSVVIFCCNFYYMYMNYPDALAEFLENFTDDSTMFIYLGFSCTYITPCNISHTLAGGKFRTSASFNGYMPLYRYSVSSTESIFDYALTYDELRTLMASYDIMETCDGNLDLRGRNYRPGSSINMRPQDLLTGTIFVSRSSQHAKPSRSRRPLVCYPPRSPAVGKTFSFSDQVLPADMFKLKNGLYAMGKPQDCFYSFHYAVLLACSREFQAMSPKMRRHLAIMYTSKREKCARVQDGFHGSYFDVVIPKELQVVVIKVDGKNPTSYSTYFATPGREVKEDTRNKIILLHTGPYLYYPLAIMEKDAIAGNEKINSIWTEGSFSREKEFFNLLSSSWGEATICKKPRYR